MAKAEIRWTLYPFLVVHPLTDDVAVHLHDMADVQEFDTAWHKLDSKYWAEFGYDLPTVWDDNCATITDFSTRSAKNAVSHFKEVREMTFAEWVDLVKHKMESDD